MKYTYILLLLALMPVVSAQIELDNVYTDPGVIAAGDNVELFVEYSTGIQNQRYADQNWQYQVRLVADDDISQEYLLITDSRGDDIYGTLQAGGRYAKQFSIEVRDDAPPATYELELQGQWYYQGEPVESLQTQTITLEVRRYAINLDIAEITSTPTKIKAGTSDAQLHITVTNNGDKAALNTQLEVELPEGMRPASTNNGQAYLARIEAASTQTTILYVDIDEDIASGEHDIQATLTYSDQSQNDYEQRRTHTIYIAEKPQLEVITANTTVAQGGETTLQITLQNTATVAAEAIDVRLLKESNQPFQTPTRSSYIAELQPGQQATVQLQILADNDAGTITHNVPLLIRAKGDSDRGDNDIYTYRDQATITVTESSNNMFALLAVVIIIGVLAIYLWRKKQ